MMFNPFKLKYVRKADYESHQDITSLVNKLNFIQTLDDLKSNLDKTLIMVSFAIDDTEFFIGDIVYCKETNGYYLISFKKTSKNKMNAITFCLLNNPTIIDEKNQELEFIKDKTILSELFFRENPNAKLVRVANLFINEDNTTIEEMVNYFHLFELEKQHGLSTVYLTDVNQQMYTYTLLNNNFFIYYYDKTKKKYETKGVFIDDKSDMLFLFKLMEENNIYFMIEDSLIGFVYGNMDSKAKNISYKSFSYKFFLGSIYHVNIKYGKLLKKNIEKFVNGGLDELGMAYLLIEAYIKENQVDAIKWSMSDFDSFIPSYSIKEGLVIYANGRKYTKYNARGVMVPFCLDDYYYFITCKNTNYQNEVLKHI